MEVKRISVDVEVVNMLQKVHYEIIARKELIATMVKAGTNDCKGFKEYEQAYAELLGEYEKMKRSVTESYIPEEYASEHYFWNMDFDNYELVILEVNND